MPLALSLLIRRLPMNFTKCSCKILAVLVLGSVFCIGENAYAQSGVTPGLSPAPNTGVVTGEITDVGPFGMVSKNLLYYFSEATVTNGTSLWASCYHTVEIHDAVTDNYVIGVSDHYPLPPRIKRTGWVVDGVTNVASGDYIVTGTVGKFSAPGVLVQLDLSAELFTAN